MKMDILWRRLALLGSLKAQLNILAMLVMSLGLALAGVSLPVSVAADPAKVNVYPIDVIASRAWYITLPSKINATPDTVKVGGSPDLMTYTDEWFRLNESKDGVVFKARTDGAHTANSSNPRSELREMSSDGKTEAAWSSTSGTHSMEIEQAVNVLPIGSKPVVVVGQIHDANDDVSVFRLEGAGSTEAATSGNRSIGSLWITDGDSPHGHLLTNSYRLGTKFRVGFNVAGGKITYSYNGQPVAGYSQSKSFSGAYFKAGSYNQSGGNCTKLSSGPDAGKCDYAEVTIYTVQLCHNGVCMGNAPGSTPPTPTSTPVSQPATPTAAIPTSTSTPGATPLPVSPQAGNIIYVSTSADGKIDTLSFKDEDILAFDRQARRWQIYFDGSDVGLSSADIDAFAILKDGSLLFSFITGTKVPGLGNVDDSDLVRFIPRTLGAQTEGAFELYFDGSDVGLTTDNEDIDALNVAADGRLIISTRGAYSVPGLAGDDTDLFAFTPQHLGTETKGAWTRYFKGSDQGFNPRSSENISSVSLNEANPNATGLYLTTLGRYEVNGLSGDGNDIFGCTLATNPCTFQLFWDGDANNLAGKVIDAMQIGGNLANGNIVAAASMVEADDGGAVDDVESTEDTSTSDDEADATQTNLIFLPVIMR